MTGLVLEGGGMRGIFTAAVLDIFLEENIDIGYVVGTSAGANVGSSYVSKQKYRSKKILTELSQDKRFMGLYNIFTERSFFGMDFLFNKIPNEIEPFDYHMFYGSNTVFKAGVTNVYTGNSTYYEKKEFEPKIYMDQVMRASSSLPIISKPVKIQKRRFLDGTVAEPIPIRQSLKDGNKYHIVVLTKHENIEKMISKTDLFLIGLAKLRYPGMKKSLQNANTNYKNDLNHIQTLEDQGMAYVFKPHKKFLENRYVKDQITLVEAYEESYSMAKAQMEVFKEWLNSHTPKADASIDEIAY